MAQHKVFDISHILKFEITYLNHIWKYKLTLLFKIEKLWLVVNIIEVKLITPIAIEIDVGAKTLFALGAKSITNWGKDIIYVSQLECLDNSFVSHVQSCTNVQYGLERINTNI